MAEVIEMPKLSDTMEVGVIASWNVEIGDTVESDSILAEVETDKATMEVPAYFDGQVLHLQGEVGDEIPLGQLIAVIGEEGEDISAILEKSQDQGGGDNTAEEVSTEAESAETNATAAAETSSEPQQTTTTDGGRLKASPLARKMAEENNLDITQIGGSGEGGRIVKRDIEEAMAQDSAAKPAPPAQAPATSTPTAPSASASSALADQPESQYEDQRVSQMRKTIANRLGESKFSAPHFYLTVPIDMENAIAFRQQLKSEDVKISFNDLVLKAVATSLRKHPAVNSSWLGDSIREHKVVNIGVAVAVPDGLVVPVVHNTDRKGMQEINAEVRELAGLAREKKLTPAQMQGNTFSVSNLGMFGIEEFTAIINPPDACILAVGGIMDTPVVKNGVVVPGKQMKVTLSCDHRVVDGATGSEFLQTLKYMLENPMRMLL